MKVRSVLITAFDLKRYVLKNSKGFDTKDYELYVALLLARLHAKQFKKSYYIGFPVKYDTDKKVSTEYSEENLEKILQSHIEEDTPIDIFLVPEDTINYSIETSVGKATGNAFQLKRFRGVNETDSTDSILRFLNEDIPKKYAPAQVSLVLIVGGGKGDGRGRFNMDQIRKGFTPKKYPFKKVVFITGDSDAIFFGELWPDFGYRKYPFEEVLRD